MLKDIKDIPMTKCPHCGSTELTKAGYLPNGYRRYQCKKCHKRISVYTTLKYYRTTEVTCPHCGSNRNRLSGRLKDGTIRRLCNNCGRSFSEKTVVKSEISEICPHCKSKDLRRSGITKNGKQRYLCKSCGKSFVPETQYKIKCPKCKNTAAIKEGKGKAFGQYYFKCLKCDHKFLRTFISEEMEKERKQIMQDYTNGVEMSEICEKYHKSKRTILKRVKRCNSETRKKNLFKQRIQNLDKKVQRDIIYFGLGAQVSVQDLSQYLKVDKEVVKYVLAQYKKKVGL